MQWKTITCFINIKGVLDVFAETSTVTSASPNNGKIDLGKENGGGGYSVVAEEKNISSVPTKAVILDAQEPAVYAAIPIIVVLIIICGCVAFFLYLWQNKRKQVDCWGKLIIFDKLASNG